MNTATLENHNALPLLANPSPSEAKYIRPMFTPTETEHEEIPLRNGQVPATPTNNKHIRKIIIGTAALVAAVAVTAYYVTFVLPFESTDDAFIESHVTSVAPQIAGRVTQLLVNDNQPVKKGELLVQIDPQDFQVKLDQAQANLAATKSRIEQAKAQLSVDQAKVETERANVTATEAEARLAQADLKRYQAIGVGGVSLSQIDLAETKAQSTAAQVSAARNRVLAAEAQVGLSKANIQTAAADVQQNEAMVHQAEIDLSYTRVTAPEDGLVTRRSVEQGAYVQTGQALLAVVPREAWVVANFKETQLTHMQAGQPVEITVDAYPKTKFKGHVDSLQSGSGARFSLLPPENASGNYVKVVQRVPVKIVFDDLASASQLLGPGMSVTPEVRVK